MSQTNHLRNLCAAAAEQRKLKDMTPRQRERYFAEQTRRQRQSQAKLSTRSPAAASTSAPTSALAPAPAPAPTPTPAPTPARTTYIRSQVFNAQDLPPFSEIEIEEALAKSMETAKAEQEKNDRALAKAEQDQFDHAYALELAPTPARTTYIRSQVFNAQDLPPFSEIEIGEALAKSMETAKAEQEKNDRALAKAEQDQFDHAYALELAARDYA